MAQSPRLNTLYLGRNQLTGCIPAALRDVATNDPRYPRPAILRPGNAHAHSNAHAYTYAHGHRNTNRYATPRYRNSNRYTYAHGYRNTERYTNINVTTPPTITPTPPPDATVTPTFTTTPTSTPAPPVTSKPDLTATAGEGSVALSWTTVPQRRPLRAESMDQ